MSYIGNTPADKYQTLQKQSFTTSATDTYTLSYAVTNPQDLGLFINNVRQNPNDAYTVSGTTLTLSSAITGSDTMYAIFLGKSVETVAPAIGSVTNSMLANSSITLNGSAVSLGGSASVNGIFETQLLHVRDEKSSGTDGGSSVAGTQTRTLNTVKTNEITGASLSSNEITLPSGTYYIQASAPAVQVNRHQAYLYNNTDSSVEVIGTSEYTAAIYPANRTFINGRFTISAEKDFIIQHYVLNATSTIGLGHKAQNGTEVYTDVQIWKVA